MRQSRLFLVAITIAAASTIQLHQYARADDKLPDVTVQPTPGAPVPTPYPNAPNDNPPTKDPGPHPVPIQPAPTVAHPTTTTKQAVTSKYIGETEKNPRLKSGTGGPGPGAGGGGGHHK